MKYFEKISKVSNEEIRDHIINTGTGVTFGGATGALISGNDTSFRRIGSAGEALMENKNLLKKIKGHLTGAGVGAMLAGLYTLDKYHKKDYQGKKVK